MQTEKSVPAITRVEEERISLKVLDGAETNVKCSGTIQEARCILKAVISIQTIEIMRRKREELFYFVAVEAIIYCMFPLEKNRPAWS
jgi:hypothetical protein